LGKKLNQKDLAMAAGNDGHKDTYIYIYIYIYINKLAIWLFEGTLGGHERALQGPAGSEGSCDHVKP
jgi:hypothetical protein